MSGWIIDSQMLVHASFCRDAVEPTVPYKSTAPTTEAMHAWLQKTDYKDGHSARALISACPLCIPEPTP